MECARPSSVACVLDNLREKGNEIGFAEVKYDGERMQIHVMQDLSYEEHSIRIYSKSGRDSTIDREYTHEIIKQALDLGNDSREYFLYLGQEVSKKLVKVNECILEGELLVYDAKRNEIEPFGGIQGFSRGKVKESEKRYTLIKFFDILHLNGTSLLRVPFIERRRILNAVIRVLPTRVDIFTFIKG